MVNEEPIRASNGRPVTTSKGGFVSCDCVNTDFSGGIVEVFNGSTCKCELVSEFKEKKQTFGIRRLKGVTNVVIRKGPGRRKR